MVIGLDCADAELVFGRWLDDLATSRPEYRGNYPAFIGSGNKND